MLLRLVVWYVSLMSRHTNRPFFHVHLVSVQLRSIGSSRKSWYATCA